MRELKLRYFIDLASNIAAKAQADARALQESQKVMQQAITGTSNKLTDWSRLQGKTVSDSRLLRDSIVGTSDKFTQLDRAISRVGTNTSTERQIGYMNRLAQSVDATQSKVGRLRLALAKGLDAAPQVAAAAAGGYFGARAAVVKPLSAFSNLEAATTELQVSMTDASGQVSKDFARISQEAVELGNKLPGTTKDFMLAARSLQTQGVPSSVIANGGLRASSYAGVLLNLNQEQAAETIAKLREAHGLKDEELVPMADLVQRGFFGFGIKPQDYLETAKYAASTYNTMGITGLAQARETLAIQGMAANVGLEGSSFGTNYAQMLTRLAQIESRKNRNSKEAKEVKALLGEHGIDMQFYDEKGTFKGNLNMLQQLSKLRALNPLEQVKVLNRLFGVEAGRPAQIMVQKGLEGYNAALGTIDNQANLDQRIEMKMQTFASKLEALGGTVENVMAQMATHAGNLLKPGIDKANDAAGAVGDFFKANPGAGTATMAAGAGAGAWVGARMFQAGSSWLANLLRGGAPAAGAVAGGAAEAGAAGGAATAAAAASGASRLGLFARGLSAMNPLMLIEMLTGPSEEDVAKLRAMDAMKAGYRGKGYDDPRRVDRAVPAAGGGPFAAPLITPQLDMLTLTAPNAAPSSVKAGQTAEVKVGEGRLGINITVRNETVRVVPTIEQQPSLVKLDVGRTNPGSN